jgi:hypothetical protein
MTQKTRKIQFYKDKETEGKKKKMKVKRRGKMKK